jgi:hypothetical protein
VQVKSASDAYIASTPELATMVTDLVSALLRDQPADPRAYAADFFTRYTPHEDGKGVVAPE